ncbi:uncharacterized protein BO80DRAFT_370028, partial [Aspergillus ibericus CBS 121593]
QDPSIKYASIEGTEFHQSHKDQTDTKGMLSTIFSDQERKRVEKTSARRRNSKSRYKQKAPAES